MAKKRIKLYTWRQWALLLPAVVAVLAIRGYQSYQQHGHLERSYIIAAASGLTMAVVIMAVVAWWGNRPEPEDKSR